MLAARSTARTLRLSLRISEPPYSDNTRPLSALYPRSPRVYMSVPAFRTACDVEGYVEYDALWAAHQTAILDGIDALVRSRIEAMLRSLAIAYADLRTALDQNEGDKTLPDSVRASCIDIPHLPSFIPRTADQPLVATDAQLVAFLSDHPLSIFLCSTCHQLRSGGCMLKHDADCNVWNDPDSGLDALDATTWARCGLPEGNSMSIDGTTLARALHLRQLFDDTTLEGSDDKIDKAARRHGLPRVHRDAESRPVKGLVCPCGRFGGSFQFVRDSFVEAVRLFPRALFVLSTHSLLTGARTASMSTSSNPCGGTSVRHGPSMRVKYTSSFLQALYQAEVAAGVEKPLGGLRRDPFSPGFI